MMDHKPVNIGTLRPDKGFPRGEPSVLPAAVAMFCASAMTGSLTMVERVAVLLGTVQFRLKLKVNLPDRATLAEAEDVARSTLADGPVRKWTLVDELGCGHPVQLAVNDFLEKAYKASRPRWVGTSSPNSFGRTSTSSGAGSWPPRPPSKSAFSSVAVRKGAGAALQFLIINWSSASTLRSVIVRANVRIRCASADAAARAPRVRGVLAGYVATVAIPLKERERSSVSQSPVPDRIDPAMWYW
jgi:hypothetical protein